MNYNSRKYNAQRYDINGIYYASSFSESVTPTEAQTFSDLINLFDSVSETDSIVLGTSLGLLDIVFMDELIRIQFTNKALNDTVRLADWLSIKRTNDGEWFN